MGKWRWLWRAGQGFDHDPTGPATSYQAHHGAYARGAAPSETGEPIPEPSWNEPTDPLHGWPPVTPEQRERADSNQRWPREADGQ